MRAWPRCTSPASKGGRAGQDLDSLSARAYDRDIELADFDAAEAARIFSDLADRADGADFCTDRRDLDGCDCRV